MESTVEKLRAHVQELKDALEAEIEERQQEFRYQIHHHKVEFEAEARAAQRAAREGLASFLAHTRPLVVLTAPAIYALILPFALLDLFVTLYQAICFPVYGIARVKRRDYIAVDRHHLAYLNALQKLNCVYCGYCNGLLAYVREIAARTEQYWCPIKHARRLAETHDRYGSFTDYGDAQSYRAELMRLRAELAKERAGRGDDRPEGRPET
ncbi:hypothetical protein [Actibacterium sp. XHP0104]|uniref:hypothetical protein n=1 Tax=Actibacterium sp. XHP0104 TaxID=2984335 RepID=UPI0021E7D993|nr:hypothetical protein [Actibacterium sp. XHP0104]MCV2882203.1 hypothetical protein [Actibacterium sp. XHP0104]